MSDVAELLKDYREETLLFHATCETFEAPPRPGAYDDVLWTALTPRIAQTYIPKAGLKLYAYKPSPFELDQKVKPADDVFWHVVARNMGLPPADVEKDGSGRLLSWALPSGWPTYREAQAWLEQKGYDLEKNDACAVLATGGKDYDVVREASWRMPGRLMAAPAEGLRFYDHARGRESDLGDLEYHDLELFRRIEAEGYDGIIINDFLQDDEYGNVGHRSHGLFRSAAARLEWLETPAVHRGWDPRDSSTPEFEIMRETASSTLASGMSR